jgi:hypothetical protein
MTLIFILAELHRDMGLPTQNHLVSVSSLSFESSQYPFEFEYFDFYSANRGRNNPRGFRIFSKRLACSFSWRPLDLGLRRTELLDEHRGRKVKLRRNIGVKYSSKYLVSFETRQTVT